MFKGFNKQLPRFLSELKTNNNKDWFADNRQRYDKLLLEPAKDFVTAIGERSQEIADNLQTVPKVNGSIRKIHRDIRFSKDKTPFHSHQHFIFWDGNKASASPGFHFVLRGDYIGFGVGQWGLSPEELNKLRHAMLDLQKVKSFKASVHAASGAGFKRDDPTLKRVPQGFDPQSPNARLLRYKHVVLRKDQPWSKELFGQGAVDFVIQSFAPLVPLHNWMVNHLR